MPFILTALAVMHLLTLHEHGSSNPLGLSSNVDRLPMAPYYLFKDLVTLVLFGVVLCWYVFAWPNALGHSDNYVEANALVTPSSIVPEWYLLPYYAVLRSIPSKLGGVVAMLGSLLVLLLLPLTDTSRQRGSEHLPMHRYAFWSFVATFIALLYLGACHVESPYVELGQLFTVLYFSHFIVAVPLAGLAQNTLADL